MAPSSDNYNQDELEAPAWLNEIYFTEVLKHAENSKEIQITSLKLSPATAKGDHYASVMFRAVVEYKLNGKAREKSMILKTMPEMDGQKKDILADSHIFETEIGVYTEMIPKFESILRAVGDDTVLGPPVLYQSLSPKKIIIFEDIVPLGYTVLRGRQATLEEARAAYTKIAKWHAISYKLNFDQPKLFEKYRHGILNIKAFTENDTYADGVFHFTEMLGEYDDLIEYKKYFEAFNHKVLPDSIAAFNEYRENPHNKGFYGLCHGDFHLKNMMFKHKGKFDNLEDIMLLDYQMSYMGPIVNDLIYSKFMLLNAEQRANHWDELMFHYFPIFQETLRKIGFKGEIPKIIEFRAELARNKTFELFLLTTFMPLWESFADGSIDVDELLSSTSTRQKLYRREKYVNEVKILLRKYLHEGYLDN